MSRARRPDHAETVSDHWWWRPGWRPGRRGYTFHITFNDADGAVVGATELHRLAAQYADRLFGMEGLNVVPVEWIHLTIQNVGFTDEVSDRQLHEIVQAARVSCARVGPFVLDFAEAVVMREAVALFPLVWEPVSGLRDRLRMAIGSVLGADAVTTAPEQAQGFRPHVSVAYIRQSGSAGPFIAKVESPDVEPATVEVRAVSLIALIRDDHLYRWETQAVIPLGSPPVIESLA